MTKEYLKVVDTVLDGVAVFCDHSGRMELDDISAIHSCLIETRPDGCKVFAVRNEVYQWAQKDAPITGEFTDSFPLSLPDDVKHFFRLAARCDYTAHENLEILLPGLLDIGSGGPDWAQITAPFHLLRFCAFPHLGMWYALRTQNNGREWDVVYANEEERDQETAETAPSLHASFSEWLEYLVGCSGWPPLKGLGTMGLFKDFDSRLSDEEAVRRYGPLEKLLPKPAPSVLVLPDVLPDLLRDRWHRRNAEGISKVYPEWDGGCEL
ncbi:MAG: hypothetical protein V4675_05000 [Verrucomicrobiota bacterium]